MKGKWESEGFCVPTYSRPNIFTASVIYLAFVDFVVLSLGAWKLLPNFSTSRISDLLLMDDFFYFTAALVILAFPGIWMTHSLLI